MRFAALCMAVFVAAALGMGCSDSGSGDEAKSLEITTPASGELVSQNRVRIQGTASGVDEVDVNGSLADVVGGEWEVVVPFDQGEVTATATAGGLTDTVTFTVDSVAPKLVLTSPERALYVESDAATTVTVSGQVTDSGTGLETVKIAEQTLQVGADGSFSFEWPVELGYSTIVVTASDLAGNQADALRGVVVGTFDDPTAPVSEAFSIFVREETLGEIATVIETVVTPAFVKQLLEENFMNENITVETISFDPLDATIEANTGVISIDIIVSNVAVTGTFTLDPDTYPVTINLARAAVNLEMTPVVLPDGSLDLQFSEAALDVADEDLTYTVGEDLSQADTEFLRDLIVNFARRAFGEFVANFVLAELYDPDILKREIELLGRTLTFELAFEEITVFPDGVLAKLSATTPAEKFPEVRDVPGALANPMGPVNSPSIENDITFTTHRLALDHIFHGVWRSGLLHQELRDSNFAGIQLPFDLTAESLATVLDTRIDTLAPPSTPILLRLRPLMPPFIKLNGETNEINGNLSEFILEFVLDQPGNPVLVASTALFIDLTINVELEGYVVKLDFVANVRADLAEETSEFDLDDEATEALFEEIGALIPAVLSQSIDIAGVADLTWVTLEDPQFEVHGSSNDHITASLKMTANPDGF